MATRWLLLTALPGANSRPYVLKTPFIEVIPITRFSGDSECSGYPRDRRASSLIRGRFRIEFRSKIRRSFSARPRGRLRLCIRVRDSANPARAPTAPERCFQGHVVFGFVTPRSIIISEYPGTLNTLWCLAFVIKVTFIACP